MAEATFVNRSHAFRNPTENATDEPNMSSVFMAFRRYGFPPIYSENKTPVTVDVLVAGFIFAAFILAASFYVVLPGYPGKQKISAFVRFTISLFIGTSIMVCNFGQEWEVGEVEARLPYKAGVGVEIEGHLGLHIGLRSINITLNSGNKSSDNNVAITKGQVEQIDYNERFYFGFGQGRNFFGPFANDFNQEFRAAQLRGLPIPILWIAEYFTFDGEGIRWGRHYRQAGWYTHIMMWLAFPMWIVTNILFFMVIRFGSYWLLLTGGSLILGIILFSGIRNFIELEIPFENMSGDVIHLIPKFGWCWYLTLITGLICIILGLIILYMDSRYPDKIAKFFDIDILQDSEEYYTVEKEDGGAKVEAKRMKGENGVDKNGHVTGPAMSGGEGERMEDMEMNQVESGAAMGGEGSELGGEEETEDVYANAEAIRQHEDVSTVSQYRKRAFSKRFDKVKSTTKAPRPHPRKQLEV